MSNDLVASKIDLLTEQIENFERSGYFTEKEIDRFTSPLYAELEILRVQLWDSAGLSHLANIHFEKTSKNLTRETKN